MIALKNKPLPLHPLHFKDLESSGLTGEQMALTGHFSASARMAQKLIGHNLAGLIFPYHNPHGKPYLKSDDQPFYRIKPEWGNLKTEDSPKYLSSAGEGNRPYFSRLYPQWQRAIKSTKIDLTEVEGEKKGDCLCSYGEATIGFSGVSGWVDKTPRPGENQLEHSRPLPELDVIEWHNRKVYQCYDSDIIEKLPVRDALFERAQDLHHKGAHPYLILLPNEINGAKNGPDDFVVRHGIEAYRVLKKAAQPSILWKGVGQKRVATLNLGEPSTYYKSLRKRNKKGCSLVSVI